MSRRSNRFSYTAVRSEGGMLPYELLEQIGGHSKELGITPTAYYLAEHEPLGEAQSRAWLRLVGLWKSFCVARDKLPEGDPAVRLTRERWLLPLFQELGYGRLNSGKTTSSLLVDQREFPISHLHGPVPIHLLGVGVSLDKRTAKVAGAIHSSPHGLVQDFLNRSDAHLWGIVSNGLQLRLLRDSHTFTRRPYLEFDLQAIFDGELYSDFRLLWLCVHASRLSPAEDSPSKPESAAMERWFLRAKEEGTRVRDRLRDGVKQAIERLGSGFMRPGNAELHRVLQSGELTPQDYYRELLRLVYRLIFVFVAEDRGVLQPPIAEDLAPDRARARFQAQQRYINYYATAKLRELALRRRGSPHGDRWIALRLVLAKLHRGCPELDLPALGSALFDPATTPHLHAAEVANADLLTALRCLCTFTDEAGVLRPVSWRHIGADELGSVFESLLELVPKLHREAQVFELTHAAGNERKTTGSYYTPESLVECLLDSALDPVLDRACAASNPERALLELKVCDPACGSGHFLVAAGRRIAHRLAQVRAGEDEPSPQARQRALRDVYARCLFGVDINPLAVELCKVSLWMEAIDPERPLPFLDGHILQGNALLGATPASIAGGIPDDAFQPIEGDDNEVAKRLRKRNRDERQGKSKVQGIQRGLDLLDRSDPGDATVVAHRKHHRAAEAIEAMPDDTLEATEAKERRYRDYVGSQEAKELQLVADTWCSAFVWPKDLMHEEFAPTHWLFERIRATPKDVLEETAATAGELAREYEFFHWHLGFPQVFSVPASGEAEQPKCGWSGGFDAVLGNPPWERIKLQEKEFFATRSEEIAGAKNSAARKKLIAKLPETEPELWREWQRALRRAMGESQLVRVAGRYPLCGRGDVNTYAIFTELDVDLVAGDGGLGCIVPAGIAMEETTKRFFASLVQEKRLSSLYHFENEEFIFPGIHHSVRFCLLTIVGSGISIELAKFLAFARQTDAVLDTARHYRLGMADFQRINPNTGTFPTFRSHLDAAINSSIYRRLPVLVAEGRVDGNPWQINYMRMFDMANDSGLFQPCRASGDLPNLPLYEAKMIHHFDHRYGTYDGQTEAQANQGTLPKLTVEQHTDPMCRPVPRYWVDASEIRNRLGERWRQSWLFGWRRSARNSDMRSIIASVLPSNGAGDSLFLLLPGPGFGARTAGLIGCMQSFAFDYLARQKIGGTNCSFYIMDQLPAPIPTAYDAPTPWHPTTTLAEWILPRVLELTYTAWDLIGFARDHGYDGPPYRWDEERRFWLRAELDAAYFHLYGLAPDEVDHVMESFWLVRQRDEKAHGRYRTKEAILDLYQRMAAASSEAPYATVLDPPPADPSVAHPPLTEAQAKELAPILERALARPAPPPAEAATQPGPSAAKPPKSKLKAKANLELDFAVTTPVDYAAAANQAPLSLSLAAEPPTPAYAATPQSASAQPDDPLSIQHLIALEDPTITPAMLDVLRALHRAGQAASKVQLVDATGLDTKRATAAINTLLDAGMIETQGRGRGTKYQLVQ